MLFAAGGSTAASALQAAASGGAFVIGSETDLYPELQGYGPLLLTSATNDVRAGVLDLMRLARRDEFPPGNISAPSNWLPGTIWIARSRQT